MNEMERYMKYYMVDENTFRKNEKAFSHLYQICFGQSMSQEEIEWRYFKNPQKELIACFAFDNDKLIANYSVSPVNLIQNNTIIKAAQSLNTMTHPDYTGKGLFVKMAQIVYDTLQKKKYDLVYGFPNYISNRTFVNKLDWTDIYEIPMLELYLKNYKGDLDIKHDILEDDNFCFDYSKCQISTSKIGVNKNREFLQWKYSQNPTNSYKNFIILNNNRKVTSRIVCKQYQNRLNIVDYCMKDLDEAESLFKYCIQYAFQLKKDLITLWSPIGTKEHLFLEKCGFKNSIPVTYFGASVFRETDCDLYNYKLWEIHLGDDNVY